jgi:hypothetical protein
MKCALLGVLTDWAIVSTQIKRLDFLANTAGWC